MSIGPCRRPSSGAQGCLYGTATMTQSPTRSNDCLFDSFGIYHYTSKLTPAMKADLDDWRQQTFGGRSPRVGYLPVEVYHLWHGTFDDRRYCARADILLRHDFDPRRDVALEGDLYEWASDKPLFHAEVVAYFAARREDSA